MREHHLIRYGMADVQRLKELRIFGVITGSHVPAGHIAAWRMPQSADRDNPACRGLSQAQLGPRFGHMDFRAVSPAHVRLLHHVWILHSDTLHSIHPDGSASSAQ